MNYDNRTKERLQQTHFEHKTWVFNPENKTKMTTIKETAYTYESPKTKNVAELKKVSVKEEIKTQESQKDDGETFEYKYIVRDGEQYRVPNSVLKQLKEQLEEKPEIEFFKVNKTGEGKYNTQYTVIPL